MEIIKIISREELNGFAAHQRQGAFQQSWEWGEFQHSAGHEVLRLGVQENGEILAAVTLVKKKIGLGKSYFYCPRGPIINFQFSIFNFQALTKEQKLKYNKAIESILGAITDLAKKEKVIFLRFEPSLKIENCKLKIEQTIDVQPSKTLVLDLSKTEDDLLKQMHQKTRYNIRLAEKKGVVIREGTMADFEDFWKLMSETRERDGFRAHNKSYYIKMLDLDYKNGAVDNVSNFQFPISNFQTNSKFKIQNSKLYTKLFLAEYEGKIITGNIMSFFGDTVTYMHGASSNEYRNVMAPFAMQWHCIRLAKTLGYKHYDFYGIDEAKWPGVTRFKKGFGGEEINYPGTFDAVFDRKWYNIYKVARKLRRLR